MKKIILLLFLIPCLVWAQNNDETVVKKIFDEALVHGEAYDQLRVLTKDIGGRLAGSPEAAAAVEWAKQVMESYEFDKVYLQEVMVPHWERGQPEKAIIANSTMGTINLNITAIGNSIGTGPKGVFGTVVEVKTFDALKALGKKNIEGKIVFFNRPFDQTHFSTFKAYGGAVNQRGAGASEAAKLGAIGVIVRSMGSFDDDHPHTGALNYALNVPKIPAIAVSTNHANLLSKVVAAGTVELYFETHCQVLEDKLSYNVIGEIKGSEFPNEYIVVGGHLDSWDNGEGAHDDGSGCVQSIEALRIFKALGIQPKRTIRAVMFMNEENGLRGGREYAKQALANKETHLAAIESDRGGFTPRGFTISATEEQRKKIQGWQSVLSPYGFFDFSQKGGGADISPLAPQGVPLMGLLPDSQRYFKIHHTAIDTFDKVNKRELHLGAGGMAAMLYLLDQHGL